MLSLDGKQGKKPSLVIRTCVHVIYGPCVSFSLGKAKKARNPHPLFTRAEAELEFARKTSSVGQALTGLLPTFPCRHMLNKNDGPGLSEKHSQDNKECRNGRTEYRRERSRNEAIMRGSIMLDLSFSLLLLVLFTKHSGYINKSYLLSSTTTFAHCCEIRHTWRAKYMY